MLRCEVGTQVWCVQLHTGGLSIETFTQCTHSAVGLSVPLDEEAGAVPDDHPLQMGRHDEPGQNRTHRSVTKHLPRRAESNFKEQLDELAADRRYVC